MIRFIEVDDECHDEKDDTCNDSTDERGEYAIQQGALNVREEYKRHDPHGEQQISVIAPFESKRVRDVRNVIIHQDSPPGERSPEGKKRNECQETPGKETDVLIRGDEHCPESADGSEHQCTADRTVMEVIGGRMLR